MTEDEERRYLERVIAGKAQPTLGPAATCGRLAQLYLSGPQRQARARPALELVRIACTVEAVAADHPLYPKLRHLEAMALRLIDPAHAADAAAIDREAWQISLEHAPSEAILFAAEWGNWAWDNDRLAEAAEAYANAHRAQRRFLLRQVLDAQERLRIQNASNYASRGAFALASTGDLQEALKLLERAGDLLSAAGTSRRACRALQSIDPDLASRLEAAQRDMHDLARPEDEKWGLDAFGNLSGAAQATQARIDALVAEVRAVPGFARFAMPSGWPDIVAAAEGTALVYLVPTTRGTLAAAVRGLGANETRTASRVLPAGLREIHAAAKPFIDAEFGSPRTDSRSQLADLLSYLATAVMTPSLEVLTAAGHGEQPFVLLPFGILTYLPLAVASHPSGAAPPWRAPGRVRFGYSARGLVEARMLPDKRPDSALVVNNPRPLPPNFDPLLLADCEAEMVGRYFPATELPGPKARTPPVVQGLAATGLAHFICHGTVSREFGYSGVLLLGANQMLTYQQIRLADVAARLVVLSACRSGASGITVEYSLSLPAAFLAAGAKGVIGTLWHAEEMATLLLVSRFYELWPARQPDPAAALVLAQDWLRSSPAEALRAVASAAALASPAGESLREAPDASLPYAHPWYWGCFFAAGW